MFRYQPRAAARQQRVVLLATREFVNLKSSRTTEKVQSSERHGYLLLSAQAHSEWIAALPQGGSPDYFSVPASGWAVRLRVTELGIRTIPSLSVLALHCLLEKRIQRAGVASTKAFLASHPIKRRISTTLQRAPNEEKSIKRTTARYHRESELKQRTTGTVLPHRFLCSSGLTWATQWA